MSRAEKRTVSQENLELIIKRIVEVAQPEKNYSFWLGCPWRNGTE